MSHAGFCFVLFFWKTPNHPGDSAPLWPRFGTLWLLAFPKTKITFEREKDFRPLMRSKKIQRGSCWPLGKLCEVPRCLLWRGLRCHCPVYSISGIFFNKWLLSYYMAGSLRDRPRVCAVFLSLWGVPWILKKQPRIIVLWTTWNQSFILKNEVTPCPIWCGSVDWVLASIHWTKGLLVRFPVRAHAWIAGQVPSSMCERQPHTDISLFLPRNK